jgi:hypothetical protein
METNLTIQNLTITHPGPMVVEITTTIRETGTRTGGSQAATLIIKARTTTKATINRGTHMDPTSHMAEVAVEEAHTGALGIERGREETTSRGITITTDSRLMEVMEVAREATIRKIGGDRDLILINLIILCFSSFQGLISEGRCLLQFWAHGPTLRPKRRLLN